ncbi:MAG: DUF1963 domain-containing protein [Candidatus Cryptobacteroides sp.]
MAIRISLSETDSRLFCCSKWWGDPDMPAEMTYPMVKGEDGEEYPLTFICQIDCADIASLCPGSGLPEEGMLYFFAAIDEYLGFETPYHNGIGRWPKGAVKVKYARSVNPETFESYIMVDDDDEPLSQPPLKIEFSTCEEGEDGLKLLGLPFSADARDSFPSHINLLQIDSEADCLDELQIYDCGLLNFMISRNELENGWWHSSFGFLSSL